MGKVRKVRVKNMDYQGFREKEILKKPKKIGILTELARDPKFSLPRIPDSSEIPSKVLILKTYVRYVLMVH